MWRHGDSRLQETERATSRNELNVVFVQFGKGRLWKDLQSVVDSGNMRPCSNQPYCDWVRGQGTLEIHTVDNQHPPTFSRLCYYSLFMCVCVEHGLGGSSLGRFGPLEISRWSQFLPQRHTISTPDLWTYGHLLICDHLLAIRQFLLILRPCHSHWSCIYLAEGQPATTEGPKEETETETPAVSCNLSVGPCEENWRDGRCNELA